MYHDTDRIVDDCMVNSNTGQRTWISRFETSRSKGFFGGRHDVDIVWCLFSCIRHRAHNFEVELLSCIYGVSRSWTSRQSRICIPPKKKASRFETSRLRMCDVNAFLLCQIMMHVVVVQVFINHVPGENFVRVFLVASRFETSRFAVQELSSYVSHRWLSRF